MPKAARPTDRRAVVQAASQGDSPSDVRRAALLAALPQPGLRWLDIGCGRGGVLREVRRHHAPKSLVGIDVIDWLADDLRDDVQFELLAAEDGLGGYSADRVLLVETLEHLEAPWSVLRAAARCVAPGGRLVFTTPNLANVRHRLELLFRGQLTAFRPENSAHLSPIPLHVAQRILDEEGLASVCSFAGRDVIPLTGGRLWPRRFFAFAPRLLAVSAVVTASRQ